MNTTALRYWLRTLTAAATLTLAQTVALPAADELVSVSHFAPGMRFATPVGMSPSMLFP